MKKYLLLAFVSCVLFSCSNDQENDLSTDIPQSSKQKIQAVIGSTEYTFDNQDQLKTAIEEMEKKGETLKSVKVLNGISTRAAGSVFTFTNGTDEVAYNVAEAGLARYDLVNVNTISTVNGKEVGYKMYKRPTWAYVDGPRLLVNPNIEGGDRAGCVILEQEGTGEWIYVNVFQKGSPRSNIFHCAGTKDYYFYFTPAGGSLISENIVSTINGSRVGYTSNKNFVEDKLYPSWLTIMGIGTNQLIIKAKPDPSLNPYSDLKSVAFSLVQPGTNEYITIWIEQASRFSTNYTFGGFFPR